MIEGQRARAIAAIVRDRPFSIDPGAIEPLVAARGASGAATFKVTRGGRRYNCASPQRPTTPR